MTLVRSNTTQRGDPFCVAQSSLDCRATSRYPALPRAISDELGSFVKQGAAAINQRGDSWAPLLHKLQ